jgi:hypothetical protein
MLGNISSLHSYHRHRVSEEDRLPFGRLVGIGMIIIGISISIFGVLSMIMVHTGKEIYTIVASVIMVIGLVVGLGLNFYAMIKYNKGIF